MKTENRT